MAKKRYGAFLLMIVGILFVVAAFVLTFQNIYDEEKSEVLTEKIIQEMDDLQRSHSHSEEVFVEDIDMPSVNILGENYIGKLFIPALSLEIPVIESWSDLRLKISPCRYNGSVYRNDMIIAGHNYQRHFGGLKELALGEKIIFRDMTDSEFIYKVQSLEILQPYDTNKLQEGEWDLTLFTCTFGGRKRIAVRCVKEKEIISYGESMVSGDNEKGN